MTKEFPLKAETHAIIGCAMEVHREIGYGLNEKPYERALVVELGLRDIPLRQQPQFEVEYKGRPVGTYVPDLIVYDEVVVDTKAIDRISDRELGQMLTYLRVTNLPLGLILNFGCRSLEWRRVVLSPAARPKEEIHLR